jgi:hypothetical protein
MAAVDADHRELELERELDLELALEDDDSEEEEKSGAQGDKEPHLLDKLLVAVATSHEEDKDEDGHDDDDDDRHENPPVDAISLELNALRCEVEETCAAFNAAMRELSERIVALQHRHGSSSTASSVKSNGLHDIAKTLHRWTSGAEDDDDAGPVVEDNADVNYKTLAAASPPHNKKDYSKFM